MYKISFKASHLSWKLNPVYQVAMSIISTILLLGLAAVVSGGSEAVCSFDCVPIKDLKSYQSLVLKPY